MALFAVNFKGIAELAGSKDNTKYDLLDTNKPETLLIKGESCLSENQVFILNNYEFLFSVKKKVLT